ncbi:MAG: hypothetical protein JNN05_11095, partial [Candidatus Omnitrophica bacterium]|nr:hypothetical protein [Candidatus Omnitrophota bacterium]
ESTFDPASGQLTFKQAFHVNSTSRATNEPEDISLLTSPLNDIDEQAINLILNDLAREFPDRFANASGLVQNTRIIVNNHAELYDNFAFFFLHGRLFIRKEFFVEDNLPYLKEALKYGALKFLGKEDREIERISDKESSAKLREFLKQIFNDDLNEMLKQEPVRKSIRETLVDRETPQVTVDSDSTDVVFDFRRQDMEVYLSVSGEVTVFSSGVPVEIDKKLMKQLRARLIEIIQSVETAAASDMTEFLREFQEYEARQKTGEITAGRSEAEISEELNGLLVLDALKLSTDQIQRIRQLVTVLGWPFFYEPKMYDKKISARPMDTEIYTTKQGEILYIQYELKDNAGAVIGLTAERVVVLEAPNPQNNYRLVYQRLNNNLGSQSMYDIKRIYKLGFDDEAARLKTDVFKRGDRVVINESGVWSYGVIMDFSPQDDRSISVWLQTPDGTLDLDLRHDIRFSDRPFADGSVVLKDKEILSYKVLNFSIGELWDLFSYSLTALKSNEPETYRDGRIQDYHNFFDEVFSKVYHGDDWQQVTRADYLEMNQKFSENLGMSLTRVVDLMTVPASETESPHPLSRISKHLSDSQKIYMKRLAQSIQLSLNIIGGQKITRSPTTPWMIKEEDFNKVLSGKVDGLDYSVQGLIKYFSQGAVS